MKRRWSNLKDYVKNKKSTASDDCTHPLKEKRLEELNSELLQEVKKKKINFAAVKELQTFTFISRADSIKNIEKRSKNGSSMLDAITLEYPFFKEHDCTVSNEARSKEIVKNLYKLLCK